MPYRSPGALQDVTAFRALVAAVAPAIGCADVCRGAAGPLGQAAEVSGLRIPNRLVVHPMEGWDGTEDGQPTALTLRRWRRFGRSGAGLVWGGEAFAVRPDGRANPNQLCNMPGADVPGALRALRAEVLAGREEVGEDPAGAVIGLQLTHSGRWSRPTAAGPAPRTAFRHPLLDERLGIRDDAALLRDEELPALVEAYAEAARLAQQAGFDFADVKVCHGYLLHEFLAARSRPGPYGGSFAHRTRLFREIVAAIRAAAPGLVLGARISISEVYPHVRDPETGAGVPDRLAEHLPWRAGFGVREDDPMQPDWEEPIAFLHLLEELDIRLVNLSLGSPYTCPHVSRPAYFPPSDGYLPPEDPLRSVARHLEAARVCKKAVPGLFFAGTGYTALQQFSPLVAEHEVGAGHVDAVGFGRMVLSYPEMLLDVLRGRPLDRKRLCRTFSDCTTAPRNGMPSGCYPLDPHYRARPEAAEVRGLRPRTMQRGA